MSDPNDLTKIRLPNLREIPRYLFDQVKGRNFDPDLIQMLDVFEPGYYAYGFKDDKDVIKGFVLFHVDLELQAVVIDIVSFDKDYQEGKKKIWKILLELVRGPARQFGVKKLYALTTRPRAAIAWGWKDTGNHLMEYNLEE